MALINETLAVLRNPEGAVVEGLVPGATRLYHGRDGKKACTWRKHDLPADSAKRQLVIELCRQDRAYGSIIQRAQGAPGIACGQKLVYLQDENALFIKYPAVKYTLEDGYSLVPLEAGISQMQWDEQVHKFYTQLLISCDKLCFSPRHSNPGLIAVTEDYDLFLCDLHDSIPLPAFAKLASDSVMCRGKPADGTFAAPEQQEDKEESFQALMFTASLSEAYVLSNHAVTLQTVQAEWEKGAELQLAQYLPPHLQMHAHLLQLGIRKDPSQRLRLEGRLGHTVNWFKDPSRAFGLAENLQKLLTLEQFLQAAQHHLAPLMADNNFVNMMGERAIKSMRRFLPDDDDDDDFDRRTTRLETSNFRSAYDGITGLRFLSTHIQDKAKYMAPEIGEPAAGETPQALLWRWFWKCPARTEWWLKLNEAVLDSQVSDCRSGFWCIPDHRSDAQAGYSLARRASRTTVRITHLLQLASTAPSMEVQSEQSCSGEGEKSKEHSSCSADDPPEQFITALQTITGSSLVGLAPNMIGQELAMFRRYTSSDLWSLQQARITLRSIGLSDNFVRDRLSGWANNVIVCRLVSADAVMVCCEAAVAEVAASTSGRTPTKLYNTMTPGLAYLAARFPTGQLPHTLELSPEEQDFVKAAIMMHNMMLWQYDAAAAVHTMGRASLQPLKDLAVALKPSTEDYFGALKCCLDSTNPVLHLFLPLMSITSWQVAAAASVTPVQGSDAERRLSMKEAAQKLGFYQPVDRLLELQPWPNNCVYKPTVKRRLIGGTVEDDCADVVRQFVDRRASRVINIKRVKAQGGGSVFVVEFTGRGTAPSRRTPAAAAAASSAAAAASAGGGVGGGRVVQLSAATDSSGRTVTSIKRATPSAEQGEES